MKHMMIKVLSVLMALTMIMGMFGAVAISAAEHTHTKGDSVKTVAPTCVAYGYTLYECAGCGETYADDILPKTEECQNIEDVKAVDATCTKNAITAGKKCKDCGKYVEGGEEVKNTALGHKYDIMLIQPTCTTAGAVIEACTRCYDSKKAWTEQAEGAVRGGDLMEGALTPTTSGTDDKGKPVHVYNYTITVAPTCVDAGKATYECIHCDEIKIENIYVAPSEALHNWVDVKDEPTCTTAGLDGKECTECWTYRSNKDTNNDGLYDMKDAVPPTNHKNHVKITEANKAQHLVWLTEKGFDITDLSKAPTCTENGFVWVYCPDCKDYVKLDENYVDASGEQPYKALGHSLPNMADEKLVKEVKDKVKAATLSATAPTVIEVTDEKGNEYSFVLLSKADCENGSVIACVRAGEPYNCEEKITLDDALTEDHKHVWPATPENPKADSTNWDYTAPSCTTAGWVVVTCTKDGCGATKTINVVNALGHDYEYTGDDCTAENGITVKCKNCRDTFAPIKNETHVTVVEKIPATCNAYAYDANVCTAPGCKYSKAVDKNDDGEADKVYTEEGFDETNHSAKIQVEGAYYIPATCITEGLATYACKNCAASSWTAPIPKITDPEHTWVKMEQVDATCQATGVTAGYICLTCADDEKLSAQLAAKNKEITDVKADAEVPYKFGTSDGTIKGKDADGNDYTVAEGEKYVWVSGGMIIPKDATKHVVKTTKFHRVGTCTMPELYLYECLCGATWSKEGNKDAKNHNTYVYNSDNQIVGGTYVKDADGNPVLELAGGKHWGALLTYVEGKQADCTKDGNHNYIKCTGCSEVIVSGYKLSLGENNVVVDAKTTWDCQICANYVADQIKANDKSTDTKSAGVVDCPGMTLVLKNKGKDSCAIDNAKTTWTVEVKATGHKTENVAATQEDCEKDGYTAGVKCVNAHCTLKVAEDGKTKYVSGHVLIPAHAGRYNVTLKAKELLAPTCTTYGVGERVYYYIDYVADVDDEDEDGDVTELIPVKKVGDGTQADGEWVIEPTTYCKVCDSRITDVTKKAWYVAPLGHKLVPDTNWIGAAADCDNIGYVAYRCERNCSDKSEFTDLNANGSVDVYWYFDDDNKSATAIADSEYTWFITNYELATSHKWPEYNLEKKTGDYKEGWSIDGKILTTDQFKAQYNGFEPTKCLVDQVYYVECSKCDARKAIADVVPATGHVHVNGEIKTPISTDCTEIEKWIGFNCAECGLQIIDKENTTHNLVVVTTKTTCTAPGLRYWACADCNKAFYPTLKDGTVVADETPTYEFYANDLVAVDWKNDSKAALDTLVYKCPAKISKIDAYVPATATEDGYYTYTCLTCKETVTKVLKAGDDVVFTYNAADVLGSKVTANGNEIVVSIAYTAKSYKFRTLNTVIYFNDNVLTFNKADVKVAFADELAATTDVAVDDNMIDILTAVNVAKAEAELKGEKVAYVDLYFTVEDYTDSILSNIVVLGIEALVYDEDAKLVEDYATFRETYEKDLVAHATGDITGDYTTYSWTEKENCDDDTCTECPHDVAKSETYYDPQINVTDLVELMDMIYTADGKYVATADINKDGKIDIDDYAALRTFTASKETAEDYANMMGVEIEKVDYAAMILDALRVQKIDLNDDGIVNVLDYQHLAANTDSELEYIYEFDMATAGWYAYFYGDVTIADITDLVLDTYEDYLDSLKVEEETPVEPAPETPVEPAPETPETPEGGDSSETPEGGDADANA